MAGAIPDLPYFAQTYAQTEETKRFQMKADLERELARESAAAQMRQTLVGGTFNLATQLGSAYMAHRLKEPLATAEAGGWGFGRTFGKPKEQAYIETVTPSLKRAAEALAAEDIALSEVERAAMPDADERLAAANRWLEKQGFTPETLQDAYMRDEFREREGLRGAEPETYKYMEPDYYVQGEEGRLRQTSEYELDTLVQEYEEKKQGPDAPAAADKAALVEKHLANLLAKARGGALTGEEVEVTLPEFLANPGKYINPLSAEALEFYKISQGVNTKRQLEISDLMYKTRGREQEIFRKAEVLTAEQVRSTSPDELHGTGVSKIAGGKWRYLRGHTLHAAYGFYENPKTGKPTLYLQREVDGKLRPVQAPLTGHQYNQLQKGIPFAVLAPTTQDEALRYKRMLREVAFPLRMKGRNITTITQSLDKKAEEDDPTVFQFPAAWGKKGKAKVSTGDISLAMAAVHLDEKGEEITSPSGKTDFTGRPLEILGAPVKDRFRVGGLILPGKGYGKNSNEKQSLANIKATLEMMRAGTLNDAQYLEAANSVFGSKAPRWLRDTSQALVREHLEAYRGEVHKRLMGKKGAEDKPLKTLEKFTDTEFKGSFKKFTAEFEAVTGTVHADIANQVRQQVWKAQTAKEKSPTAVRVRIGGSGSKVNFGKARKKPYVFDVSVDWNIVGKRADAANDRAVLGAVLDSAAGARGVAKAVKLSLKNTLRRHLPAIRTIAKKAKGKSYKLTAEQWMEAFKTNWPSWEQWMDDNMLRDIYTGKQIKIDLSAAPGNPYDLMAQQIGNMPVSRNSKLRRFANASQALEKRLADQGYSLG